MKKWLGRMAAVTGHAGRSSALWTFGVVWVAGVLAHVFTGQGLPLFALLMTVAFGVWCATTIALTEPDPVEAPSPSERRRVWLQLALILGFVALTARGGLVFHGVVAANPVPIWSPLIDALDRLGEAWTGNGNFVSNPVTYLVLPLVALLLTRSHPQDLGFGHGHRVGRVVLLWCAVPVGVFILTLAAGQVTLLRLLERFASHFLQNGLMEEFLFRGALYTRLRMLTGVGWALVIQALIFGVWHLGLGYANTGHSGLLPALATVIVNQSVAGLAFGVIFERTRNLIAPTAVHVALNSLG